MWGNPPSTTSTRLFRIDLLSHPHSIFFQTTLTIAISYFSQAGQQYKGKYAATISVFGSPTSPPPRHSAPSLYLTLIPVKVRSTPRHSVQLRHTLLDKHFSCISRNILSMHSPSSSFNIDAARPGHPNPLRRWREIWKTTTKKAAASGHLKTRLAARLHPFI